MAAATTRLHLRVWLEAHSLAAAATHVLWSRIWSELHAVLSTTRERCGPAVRIPSAAVRRRCCRRLAAKAHDLRLLVERHGPLGWLRGSRPFGRRRLLQRFPSWCWMRFPALAPGVCLCPGVGLAGGARRPGTPGVRLLPTCRRWLRRWGGLCPWRSLANRKGLPRWKGCGLPDCRRRCSLPWRHAAASVGGKGAIHDHLLNPGEELLARLHTGFDRAEECTKRLVIAGQVTDLYLCPGHHLHVLDLMVCGEDLGDQHQGLARRLQGWHAVNGHEHDLNAFGPCVETATDLNHAIGGRNTWRYLALLEHLNVCPTVLLQLADVPALLADDPARDLSGHDKLCMRPGVTSLWSHTTWSHRLRVHDAAALGAWPVPELAGVQLPPVGEVLQDGIDL
mmetsp:Transcript_80754/g.237314  ORF Transcript_80754/g.237314 Transcript_80754/m.237314 type:complete len:394 (-) Transcript_80754:131-1312(-)